MHSGVRLRPILIAIVAPKVLSRTQILEVRLLYKLLCKQLIPPTLPRVRNGTGAMGLYLDAGRKPLNMLLRGPSLEAYT